MVGWSSPTELVLYKRENVAPPSVLRPTTIRWLLPKRVRNKLPKLSKAADTSPIEEPSASMLLSLQVIPPSSLYFVTSAHVSDMKRLTGLAGLMAMHSSALLPAVFVMLIFLPTVSVIAA